MPRPRPAPQPGSTRDHHRTIVIGAGAAGLFCAGRAGPGTGVLDRAAGGAEKVRIPGGGRCNITNIEVGATAGSSARPWT